MRIGPEGVVDSATQVASPNCDARPPETEICLLVIHCISLPPGEFGGGQVMELFTNTLNVGAHPYFAALAGLRVSSHFYIRRDGTLIQFVPCRLRAWHAGQSEWKGRQGCNDFSIGIELEGTEEEPFEPSQYQRLAELTRLLQAQYPIKAIVGHSDIAPGRKTDPGRFFDWPLFHSLIQPR